MFDDAVFHLFIETCFSSFQVEFFHILCRANAMANALA